MIQDNTPKDLQRNAPVRRVTFTKRVGFHAKLRERVRAYFEDHQLTRNANSRMVTKSLVIVTLFGVTYFSMLTSAGSPLLTIFCAAALAQCIVLIGLNIMHDANHGSYFSSKRSNRILGYALDLIGGSSLLWRTKHNLLHHTYTNCHEVDDDLEVPAILRFSPGQPWRPCHRYQHWYAFPVYCFMTLLWAFKSDFQKYFSGKIGEFDIPQPSRTETVLFFSVRLFYFFYMLIVPMFFHPVIHVLLLFLLIHAIVGLTLAVVFQVAHVVEESVFIPTVYGENEIEQEWAIHQIESTSNFSPTSKLASAYCGGLNFQIEHHLFPNICHIHYPAISKIIKETCNEFGVSYVSYPTFRKAIGAHVSYLRTLGREPAF
jgi:linoleoyl-CoA desaturase